MGNDGNKISGVQNHRLQLAICLAKQKDINKSEFNKMMAGQLYNAMDYSMLKMRQENNKKTEA